MSWVLAILGFVVLIVLHEAGHFAAAKAVGMRVERFSLFMGKPLVSVRRGETEYGIGWAPVGGYVKISGMNPHEKLAPEVASRAYFAQPVWKRLVVIGAGPLVNLVLAFLILLVLFWSTGTFKSNDQVGAIERGSPAAGVLQRGDRILAVDGKRGDLTRLVAQIGTHTCKGTPKDGCLARTPAQIELVRGGEAQTVAIRPRWDAKVDRPRIGFSYGTTPVPLGPVDAAGKSLSTMWDVTSATVGVVVRLFYSPEARDQVSGIVGISDATHKAVEQSVQQAFFLIGLISLSLAVMNLFPFLPLDGGHIFWALAEKVRGRAIPFAVMERASVVGIILILMLFVIGLQNDIGRLGSG